MMGMSLIVRFATLRTRSLLLLLGLLLGLQNLSAANRPVHYQDVLATGKTSIYKILNDDQKRKFDRLVTQSQK